MKREVVLAVAVGVAAGLLGALTAPSSSSAPPAQTPATGEAATGAAENDFQPGALSARAAQTPATRSVLVVRVERDGSPMSALAVNLSRWSARAGKGGDGEWTGLPRTQTDAQGLARFEVAAGTYWVSAAGTARTTEVQGATQVTLTLEPGLPLTGHVLEAGTRTPLASALIIVRQKGSDGFEAPEAEAVSMQTDSLGRFSFASLPKGTLHLEVDVPGHRRQETEVVQRDEVEVFVERACHVIGRLVPPGVATVSEAGSDLATVADEQGNFTLDVDCGGATLLARDAEGRIGSTKLPADSREALITLEGGTVLHGTVTVGEQPLAGAEVAALTGDEQLRDRATSDDRGAFVLGPLVPGNYIVRARKGRGTLAAVYGVDVPAQTQVTLVAEAPAALEGRVVDGPGADVMLWWVSARGERPVRVHADDDGTFHFDDVPPGAATVTATLGARSQDARVFLSSGTSAQVELTLQAHGHISGFVTGPGNAGAHVSVSDKQGEHSRSTTAGAEGAFVVEVPPGQYHLMASAIGGRYVSAMRLRLHDSVTVVAGQDVHSDIELLANGEGWGEMPSVARGEIGASFETVNGNVQLSWIVSDSPVARAGLQVGDLVTAIDGEPVHDALDAFSRTRGTPGASISLSYLRGGAERTVAVALAK